MEKNTVVHNTLPKTAWNSLSQAEKAEIIKVAVKNNITDLKTIRQKYNEFAEGGNTSDEDYYTTMYKVAKENNSVWNTMRREEGSPELSVDAEYTRILNDNTYDYKGYYNKYPQSQANAKSHWTDEFKTVWHPTFSVESRYSGKKSEYNPFVLEGGIPEKNDMPFIPTAWQRHEANRYGSGGPLVEGGNIYDGTTMPTQQMRTDATYVNTPIAPIYSPVHQLPEVTVRPDSNLSPAERVLAERARKQAHDRAFGKGSYDAYRRQEQTDYLRDKAARPTNVDRALDYAASLVSGIGQGADIASMTIGGLPVYSALKGAKALSEKDYVDGAMWMTPILGIAGKKAYDVAKPVVKEIIDNGTLWDAYTSFRGRLGNYGNNVFTNMYGTAARRFGLPDKARIPADVIRKIKGDVHISNGIVDFTGNKYYLGNPHVNVTLDRGVVSHGKGVWDGANTYVSSTQDFINQAGNSLKSIEPSDMFSNGAKITAPSQKVTLISGDIESLNKAKKMGMQTLSSPKLRRIYNEGMRKYKAEKSTFDEQYANSTGIQKRLLKDPHKPQYTKNFWPEYTQEIQRLQTQRGTPTLADFGLLEQQTGLKSGVAPMLEYDNAIRQLDAMKSAFIHDITSGKVQPYVYPNGRIVDWGKADKELELIRKAKYNNVFYDPASYAESDWQIANGVK